MELLEQFKSLNLKKKMRKICTDEVREVKMKIKVFCNLKKCILFSPFFDCSFGFAFQRCFGELEKAIL